MFIVYMTKEVILGKFSSVIIHYKISLTGRKLVFVGEERLKMLSIESHLIFKVFIKEYEYYITSTGISEWVGVKSNFKSNIVFYSAPQINVPLKRV